jgi:hypothetical protein
MGWQSQRSTDLLCDFGKYLGGQACQFHGFWKTSGSEALFSGLSKRRNVRIRGQKRMKTLRRLGQKR